MDTLEIIKRAAKRAPNPANANAVVVALDRYGSVFGLDQPHRLAQYLAQIMHESGEFRFDTEVWGPTPAQQRYDTRVDLGNSPQLDGDGKLYMGRTGIQITGKANYRAFRDWCREKIDRGAPDFVARPELVNTDPWEGLAPIWYWSVRGLNRYADQGDVETITVKINGGRNGFTDRLEYLVRVSLAILGYQMTEIRDFQAWAQSAGFLPKDEPGKPSQVDGDAGPKTRAAMHQALVILTRPSALASSVRAAPVVEEKPVAVIPSALDKPVEKTGGFWERIGQIGALTTGLGGVLFGDWKVTAVALGGGIIIAGLGLVFHARIVAAVKDIKAAVTS